MKKKVIEGAPTVIKIKKAGWIYIALCILMGIGAINTANNLVYIIVALMLGFMAVSGFFGVADMNRLHVEIGVPDEIYAGISCPVSVKLINGRRLLPAFLIRVHIKDKDLLFPFTDTEDESIRFTELVFDRRGQDSVKNIYISTVFPFNFFIRYKDLDDKTEVVVFPAPVRCSSVVQGEGIKGHGERVADAKGFEAELMSVRNYVHGDSLRLIHWKATARTGSLKVKELAASGAEPIVIELEDLHGSLEERLSCAVWLINMLMEKGAPVGLKTADAFYPPNIEESHRLEMLKGLALYG